MLILVFKEARHRTVARAARAPSANRAVSLVGSRSEVRSRPARRWRESWGEFGGDEVALKRRIKKQMGTWT